MQDQTYSAVWTQFWSGALFGEEQNELLIEKLWNSPDELKTKVMSQFNAVKVWNSIFADSELLLIGSCDFLRQFRDRESITNKQRSSFMENIWGKKPATVYVKYCKMCRILILYITFLNTHSEIQKAINRRNVGSHYRFGISQCAMKRGRGWTRELGFATFSMLSRSCISIHYAMLCTLILSLWIFRIQHEKRIIGNRTGDKDDLFSSFVWKLWAKDETVEHVESVSLPENSD